MLGGYDGSFPSYSAQQSSPEEPDETESRNGVGGWVIPVFKVKQEKQCPTLP